MHKGILLIILVLWLSALSITVYFINERTKCGGVLGGDNPVTFYNNHKPIYFIELCNN